MNIFIISLLLVSGTVFANTDLNKINSRLDYIQGEKKIIQKRIEDGQDPKLFKSFLVKFANEENKLRSQKKALTEKIPTVEKKVSKSKPKSKIKSNRDREIERMKKDISFLIRRNRENKSSSKKNEKKYSFGGHYQIRNEHADNRQGVQGTTQSGQTFSRLRVDMKFQPNKNLIFHLAPQAVKTFGGNNGSKPTSGSTVHSGIDFFEANIVYKLNNSTNITIGKQELAYGDHLIIGSLPWANAGRSFDAIKVKHNYKNGWIDAFWSKIDDNSSDGAATSTTALKNNDDKDFYGIYNSWVINKWLKPFDLYLLQQIDNTALTRAEINTIGFRIKGEANNFFYRTENGTQSGTDLDEAYQYNVEIGGKILKHKISIEYATAGKDYVQMYPTAHKFLGFSDVLGRKNINQMAVHYASGFSNWFKFKLSYHKFNRNDTKASASKLGGASWGTSGDSDDIGSEVDFVMNFITKDSLKLQLGGGFFSPGEYLKDQDPIGDDDQIQFIYTQLIANF